MKGLILGSKSTKYGLSGVQVNKINILRRSLFTAFLVMGSGRFDKYLNSVQSRSGAGVPTFDEARKDFRAAIELGTPKIGY